MDRITYLNYRTNNNPLIMYEYYKENYKGDNPLDLEIFGQILRLWPHAQEAYRRVLTHYDQKFELMIISDLKTGNIIKFI